MTTVPGSGSTEAPTVPAGVTSPSRTTPWRSFKDFVKSPVYWFYQRRLERDVKNWNLPKHIGFIMDGNRRFARASGLSSVSQGHEKGAEKLFDVLNWCYDCGVRVVTVWSFSLDNFHRDTSEVQSLLDLFESKTRELADSDQVHERQLRVRFLGQLDLLPEGLQKAIQETEAATAHYTNCQLNIAMAYGGREEITDAFRSFLKDQQRRGHAIDDVLEHFEEDSIEPYLYTSGQPEPDLIFRTSGEVRLSGFLLWQSAYSEFYFCDANWPALRRIDILRALRSYHERHRRMGR